MTTHNPLPPLLEIAGWFILGLMFGMLAMTTGCRHCEYTASAEATHSDGAECYTAKVEVTSISHMQFNR